MKHLLNTLFVLTEDCYLTLDGENVVVVQEENTIGRMPLHTLESILYFGYKGASPSFMGACVKRHIALCFFTPNGRFLARASGGFSGERCACHRPGPIGGKPQIRNAHDAAQLQGPGIPNRFSGRLGGWPVPFQPFQYRRKPLGGGAPPVLCWHYPRPAEAVFKLCRPADDFQPAQSQSAFQVFE